MDIEQKISEYWTQIYTFASDNILSVNALIELGIILACLVAGFFARASIAPALKTWIGSLSLPWRFQVIAQNLTKLIFHIIALILLGLATLVTNMEALAFETDFIAPISKLLAAWVFIKLVSQFIANTFLRGIVSFGVWVIAALSILGILDDTVSALDALGFEIGDFRLSVLSIFQSLVGIILFVSIAIFISNLIERKLNKSSEISPSAQVLISKIVKFTFITIAILVGITSAGIDLSVLAVFGGALGLGLGFGLQTGVSNLFSGMLLLLDRSIKPGDIIEMQNGTFGWVEHMNARYTNIVTRDNKSFLVPNEDLITQRVVNWSHGDTLVRLEVEFGVHYDSDPHLIRKIAAEAAATPKRVSSLKEPVCHFTEFGDSSLNFKLRFWITDAQEGVTNIRGQVMLALWDAFKENDIQIPYPHREVFLHKSEN